MFLSLLPNCNLWLVTFMAGYIHAIYHDMKLPVTKMAFCMWWQTWQILHHFSSPHCTACPPMRTRGKECVMVCVQTRETDCMEEVHRINCLEAASGSWVGGWRVIEFMCFRRLSFNVKYHVFKPPHMSGSTRLAYISLKGWPWPLTSMQKGMKKESIKQKGGIRMLNK